MSAVDLLCGMPENLLTYRLLLISPSDVNKERDVVTQAVARWNAQIGEALKARVDVVKWETHAAPDLSGPPQEVLGKQIVDGCDFGLAVFWTRIGTPTPTHISGSVEEIERLCAQKKRVMLYFCERAIRHDADIEEYSRLRDVRGEYEKQGLIGTYVEPHELESAVLTHLTSAVKALLSKKTDEELPSVLAQAWSDDLATRVGGSGALYAIQLATRTDMYKELIRLLTGLSGPVRVRATSVLPYREQSFDPLFRDYMRTVAQKCRAATLDSNAASYINIVACQVGTSGKLPDHREEAIRVRRQIFDDAGAGEHIAVFQIQHHWLLNVLTINDEHAVIGFPKQATDPHLSHAVRLSGQPFVSQITQWFDTCLLPSARVVDLETLRLRVDDDEGA